MTLLVWHSYESDLVHMAARHVSTGKYGCVYTPTEELSTVCRATWEERPRRTLMHALVTCPRCAELAGN